MDAPLPPEDDGLLPPEDDGLPPGDLGEEPLPGHPHQIHESTYHLVPCP